MTTEAIDFAASHTLTTLREIAGDTVAAKLVTARGGMKLYLPETVTPSCELAQILGLETARQLVQKLGGGRTIAVPNGRGYAHGRRIPPAEVCRLRAEGLSVTAIAKELGCTSRQVLNILAKAAYNRQNKLF